MPTYTAYPPEDRVLLAVDRVLRTGIAAIPASAPPTAWAHGQPCPAGHAVFPAGLRIYLADSDEDMQTPAIVIFLDGDPQRAAPRSEVLWNVEIAIDLLWPLDQWDTATEHAVTGFVKNLLTNDIQLPGGAGISRACDRLSDSTITFVGSLEENNFPETSVQRLQDNAGHPLLSIRFRAIVAGISS
jgi:hypothetical protein